MVKQFHMKTFSVYGKWWIEELIFEIPKKKTKNLNLRFEKQKSFVKVIVIIASGSYSFEIKKKSFCYCCMENVRSLTSRSHNLLKYYTDNRKKMLKILFFYFESLNKEVIIRNPIQFIGRVMEPYCWQFFIFIVQM